MGCEGQQTPQRIALIIEGTMAMASCYREMRAMYIEPLLRVLKPGEWKLVIIIFRTKDVFSASVVESTEWLTDLSEVRQVLDGISFVGGGLCELATIDALAELAFRLDQCTHVGAQPECNVLMLHTSDHSKQSLVLPLAPCSAWDASKPATSDEQCVQLSSGSWRHTFISLVAVLKHSQGVCLSIALASRDTKPRMQLIMLWGTSIVGRPQSADIIRQLHREQMQSCSLSFSRSHMVVLAPTWSMARIALSAERRMKAAEKQLAAANQQGQSGGNQGSGGQPHQRATPTGLTPGTGTPQFSPPVPVSSTPDQAQAHYPQQYLQQPAPQPPPQQGGSGRVKSVVWSGQICVHSCLLPALETVSTHISLGQFQLESSAPPALFSRWPHEIVLTSFVPQRDVQEKLNSRPTGYHRIACRLLVAAQHNSQVAVAYVTLVDTLKRNQALALAHLPDQKLLVQLKEHALPSQGTNITSILQT